jgi:hypothetical protein
VEPRQRLAAMLAGRPHLCADNRDEHIPLLAAAGAQHRNVRQIQGHGDQVTRFETQ